MDHNSVLPYLDVPFQHAHPEVLKRMARPSNNVHELEQISEGVQLIQILMLDQLLLWASLEKLKVSLIFC